MNRFVKKHYHLISFILLAMIFVAWGLLETNVLPGLLGEAPEKTETMLASADINEEIPADEHKEGTDIAEPDHTSDISNNENQSDNPSENLSVSDKSNDTEPHADTVQPDDIGSDEQAEPSLPAEPEEVSVDGDAAPAGEDTAPADDVVLEDGTYGPGEGEMPFDLCLANVRESLNVRSGPGEDNEVIAKFLPGDYARVLEKGTEWSKITSGDITGYAHNDYLITGNKALQKITAADKLTVTVTQKLINVRASKSTEAEILRQAKKDEVFKCIASDSDSDWFAIKLEDGNTGYVATTLAHVTAEMDNIVSLTPVG